MILFIFQESRYENIIKHEKYGYLKLEIGICGLSERRLSIYLRALIIILNFSFILHCFVNFPFLCPLNSDQCLPVIYSP